MIPQWDGCTDVCSGFLGGLRLLFEVRLFGYYDMALAVSLVLVDIVGGRIRNSLVAWLVEVSLISVVPRSDALENELRNLVPLLIIAAVLLLSLRHLQGKGDRRTIVPWLALAGCALLTQPGNFPLRQLL